MGFGPYASAAALNSHDKRRTRSSHGSSGGVEVRGQRLSSYAASGSKDEEDEITKSPIDVSIASNSQHGKKESLRTSTGGLYEYAISDNRKCINKTDLPATGTLTTSIAGHRHSLPLQNNINENHQLKCSCVLGNIDDARPTIEKSILERKQNVLAATAVADERKPSKGARSRKEKRDAATSPQLPIRNGLKPNTVAETITVSPCHATSVLTNARPSPRREIPMRNAATSPQRDDRKIASSATSAKSSSPVITLIDHKPATPKPLPLKNPITSKIMLEKSKSLSDSPPTRQLRTTRSLSPRPPVRHQQAIIISDENDVVLKVTPSEYFDNDDDDDDDDEVFAHDESRRIRIRAIGKKAQSENTSPNLSNSGGTFFDATDRYANNRSTGCLVYVPSDPWMKQSEKEASGRTLHNARSATLKEKSDNLKSLADDPWIYRRVDDSSGNQAKQALTWLNRQSKSMSSNINEGPMAARGRRRKLQHSKTPAAIDDIYTDVNGPKNHQRFHNSHLYHHQHQLHKDNKNNGTEHTAQKNVALPFSPQRTPLPPPPSSPPQSLLANATNITNGLSTITNTNSNITNDTNNQQRAQNFLLNVVNPNMLQPRHSFSTLLPIVPQKDDELQLNIRRLSEQIKSPIGYSPGLVGGGSANSADFSTYLSQMRQTPSLAIADVTPTIPKQPAKASKGASRIRIETTNAADLVLETTC